MKIGLLIYGSLDTLSGGYYYDRQLVAYLEAQGDTVEIISLPWRNYAAHLSDNLHFRLPSGLDILIQDELNHPSLIFANRNKPNYPVVSLVHHLRCSEQRPTWQNWFYRQAEKTYLSSVDGFIFNSLTTQKVVQSVSLHNKPYVVAYPPTDRFGSPVSTEFVSTRSTQPGPLKIVFVGNLIKRKGLHTLIKSLGMLQSSLQVDIIGGLTAEPTYAAEMQTLAAGFPDLIKITFHGALEDEHLAEKLKNAHLMVVPSSYEGFGIVYLEGMAFGLPAMGTTAGAAGEIIENEKTGYLIKPDDAAGLAEKIKHLTENRTVLKELSLNALRRYQQQPAWPQTAKNIRQFLASLFNENL